MKTFLTKLFAFILVMPFVLSSCSKDEPEGGNKIVGYWKYSTTYSAGTENLAYANIMQDGTFVIVSCIYLKDEHRYIEVESYYGKWELKGNVLTNIDEDGEVTTGTVKFIGNKMITTSDGVDKTWTGITKAEWDEIIKILGS